MKPARTYALLLFVVASASPGLAQERSFSVTVSGTGKPMLLIPGLLCPGKVWDSVVDHYRSQYQLHVLTIAGFGGQRPVPGLRLSTVRDDIVSYIRENKLDHPVVVGHSLGGFMALWIAETSPDLTGRIVSVDGVAFLPALANPSAQTADGLAQATQMQKMYSALTGQQLEAVSKMSMTQLVSDSKNVEQVARWAGQSDSAFVGQAMYDMLTTDLRPGTSKIKVPLLLIGSGKGARSATREAYEAQIAGVPNHRLAMATNSLHFIMYDDPGFLFSSMDDFLKDEARIAR